MKTHVADDQCVRYHLKMREGVTMNSRSEAAKIVVCAGSVLFILLPTVKANAAIDDESRLLKLATMKFGCLRYAEEQMFRKVVNGELADCSDDVEKNNDPNNAVQWDKETRTIRAQCVEWLCTNREASEMVTHKGICVKGARIEGGLNLSFIRIAFPLRFTNSAFPEGISLLYAEISILDLEGTYTGPITADGLKVNRAVRLRNGFKTEGMVTLAGATITGDLDCSNGQCINKGACALNAYGLDVGGSVFLRNGFKAEGAVDLCGAIIGGYLDCEKGMFINPNGYALDARTIKVSGDVNLRNDFRAEGEVCLKNAKIGCGLHCEKSVFFNPGKAALQADGMNVTGSVFLRNGFRAEGSVDLTAAIVGLYLILEDVNSPEKMSLGLWSARVGTLQDKAGSWPSKGNLYLHGLVYDTIHDDAPRDAKNRIDWLRRQPIFRPQPYEQLAAVLRKGGQDEDAREVLIAKNDDRAHLTQLTTLSEKFWYRIFGPMIGYGYHPLNTLWGVVVFVVLGCFLFAIGYMGGLITPEKEFACSETTSSSTDNGVLRGRLSAFYPRFNFLVYSIDAFVPLIDLHQAKYWLPNAFRGPKLLSNKVFTLRVGGLLRLYLWIHITMGWFLTTLFVVGMTGVIRT
jgi:sRNA-binding regulator protein Hfq